MAAASFFLGSRMDARWQEVWPCHENKSRKRCAWRASRPPLRSFCDRMNRQWRDFFSLSGSGCGISRWPVLYVVARSERALPKSRS